MRGLGQGVGFRPFIYRIAVDNHIAGNVRNDAEGVVVFAEGSLPDIRVFTDNIKEKAPSIAKISEIIVEESSYIGFSSFTINTSDNGNNEITRVSPDIAVCPKCLDDMKNQPSRINYPLLNCTCCGPRFSIIKELPYDRKNTTMDVFSMCDNCAKEYTTITNRRFHAQPTACNHCGPQYSLLTGNKEITGTVPIVQKIAELIQCDEVIAIKGIGGYHLICDAGSEKAVQKLRSMKIRETKPFAVMFRDVTTIEEYASVNDEEKNALESWQRPVVILNLHRSLAESVTMGLPTIGAILPYMPFHYLMWDYLTIPAIVFTSGNLSDEPVIISNREAKKILFPQTKNMLFYNRKIHNRTDDSVVQVLNESVRIIRRSRGYVPDPVIINEDVEGIFAAGAELVNCFAIGKGNEAFLSQHIGDLKNGETFEFYRETAKRFMHLFRFKPQMAVTDLHPDYLSTLYAESMNVPLVKVQHHHAHIVSAMAVNHLKDDVIGMCFDGTGLGTDGNIWGSEIMICNRTEMTRKFHFEYVTLPGGDKAAEEPWRIVVSYLYRIYGKEITKHNFPFLDSIPDDKIHFLNAMIERSINSPLSCGAGRLFDAVSFVTGSCKQPRYHAEAPVRLESMINPKINTRYDWKEKEGTILTSQLFQNIVEDVLQKVPVPEIASKFHNTIISVIFVKSLQLREETGINKIVLSGGTFQNRYLLENTELLLKESGFDIITARDIPVNDAGIALGQIAIAAELKKTGKL